MVRMEGRVIDIKSTLFPLFNTIQSSSANIFTAFNDDAKSRRKEGLTVLIDVVVTRPTCILQTRKHFS